jgi:transcriptional regulator
MYLPPLFKEEDPDVLRRLMAAHPLAALVTYGPDGLTANHLPFLLDPDSGSMGTLRGHLARANPQWPSFQPDVEALAIFQGPHAYISPNWYPTKQETGRAVPTWNYAVVHVWGRLRVYSDAARLRTFLDALTATHEAGQPEPWKPSDAPAGYIDGLLKGIVGIELAITRWEGKWKVSQNQPEVNREGAAEGLAALPGGSGEAMARLIRGPKAGV